MNNLVREDCIWREKMKNCICSIIFIIFLHLPLIFNRRLFESVSLSFRRTRVSFKEIRTGWLLYFENHLKSKVGIVKYIYKISI